MILPLHNVLTNASARILLAEFPVHKNNTLKVFSRLFLFDVINIKKYGYFIRMINQIMAALIKLKKTAALPISLARFASL